MPSQVQKIRRYANVRFDVQSITDDKKKYCNIRFDVQSSADNKEIYVNVRFHSSRYLLVSICFPWFSVLF